MNMNEEWYNMVRRTDPETSKTAAKQEVQRTRRAKDRVLEIIIDIGGTSGMTDEEISFHDGVITSKYRTARVWLERQHYIGAVGQRKSKHGKYQRVWFATEKGKVLYCKIKESK
jgi:hypothetical protein